MPERSVSGNRHYTEKKLDDALEAIARHDRDLNVLLRLSIGRIALKNHRRLGYPHVSGIDDILTCPVSEAQHVADWLRAAVVNREDWLSNLDGLGRPKKLMKFGSFPALLAEVNRTMIRKARQTRVVPLVEGHEEEVWRSSDGWSIVRLLTPEALDAESATMQHCVGHGAYDCRLQEGDTQLVSLRDPRGKRHVTMEVEHGKLRQISGKQNATPCDRYIGRVIPFLEQTRVSCNGSGLPLISDQSGAIHRMSDLPERLDVDGDFKVMCLDGVPLRLPREIRATGSVSILGGNYRNFPDVVEAGENVRFGGPIDRLPAGLAVGLNLDVSGSRISSLPEGLEIGGLLNVSDTPMQEIPRGIRCAGLDISNTCIREIDTAIFNPDGPLEMQILRAVESGLERIKGDLRLEYVNIAHTGLSCLPESVDVYFMNVQNSPLRRIPGSMSVRGELRVVACRIDFMPEVLQADLAQFCRCSLVLPDGFQCTGTLSLSEMPELVLPSAMYCRELFIRDCGEVKLPGLLVADRVDLRYASIESVEGAMAVNTLLLSASVGAFADTAAVTGEIIVGDSSSCIKLNEASARKLVSEIGSLRWWEKPELRRQRMRDERRAA